jgi:hypothetical protein
VTKPQSATQLPSSFISGGHYRFLLKSTANQLWLADHDRIADTSDLYTEDPCKALQFVDPEMACQRARLLLRICPDITVDLVQLPASYGRR